MNVADISFDITDQTNRFIQLINTQIRLNDVQEKNTDHYNEEIYIRAYEGDEKVSVSSDENVREFISYLEDNGVADCPIGWGNIQVDGNTKEIEAITEFTVEIKSIDGFKRLKAHVDETLLKRSKQKVSIDEEGYLHLDGERKMKFTKNKNAHDLLRLITKNNENRAIVWSFSEKGYDSLRGGLSLSRVPEEKKMKSIKNTAESINKRFGKELKTDKKLLIITSNSLQLNPDFT